MLLSQSVVGPGTGGVPAYGSFPDRWRWVHARTVRLHPGETYILAGFSPGAGDAFARADNGAYHAGFIDLIPDGARYALGPMAEDRQQQRFETLPGYAYQAVNFALVPEPASWSLMIMGFGLCGAMLRQARQREVASAAS